MSGKVFQRLNEKIYLNSFGKFTSPVSISRLLFYFAWWYGSHMPDIVIGFLIGCALGFVIGFVVREQMSRKRRLRNRERTGY